VRSLDDLHTLLTFFEARRGRLHGFRWRDPVDWKSCAPSAVVSPTDQALGTGDGAQTAFQLIKRYADAEGASDRIITKPVAGTVLVALDGGALTEGADFSVDATTGVVTLSAAPSTGVAITAGFEFDTPVRFDLDQLTLSLEAFNAGDTPDAPVIEIL
jgi:uncharacterized protein (TIGR02217 family)